MKITESMIPAELLDEARRYWHQTRSPLIVYSNSIYDREVKVYADGPGYKFSVGDPYDPEVPTWREFLEERCMSLEESMENYNMAAEDLDEQMEQDQWLEYGNPLEFPAGLAFDVLSEALRHISEHEKAEENDPVIGQIFAQENGGMLGDYTGVEASGDLLPGALQYLLDKHGFSVRLEFRG